VVFLFHDGRAERRAVRTSETSGDELLVTAGLAAGDRVILNPPEGLKQAIRFRRRANDGNA